MDVLKNLKICFLVGTLGQGGAERQLFYIVESLKKSGAEPYIISLSKGEFWESKILELGIPIYFIQDSSKIMRIIHLWKLIKKISPKIIQSHHFYLNLYVWMISSLFHIVGIGAIRSNGLKDVEDVGKILGQLSLKFPKYIITNNKKSIENIRALRRTKGVFYLPNVIDIEKFNHQRRINQGAVKLLMVGRLGSPKRFDKFLELISSLIHIHNINIIGHIVGDGHDLKDLQKLSFDLEIPPENLIFHGSIENVELIYRLVDIYIHISDWEGTPNVILEAMASGLPVIASDVGGISELVQNGITGYLFDNSDKDKLVELTQELIKNKEKRFLFGVNGKNFISTFHSIRNLPQRLDNIYMQILLRN